ncbi:MAG TPA: cytochrome c-type biogenesis protein [Chloroflexota bacterium]|nr:cytochrome c-type biogenesis protein [Chloroflexota bacterium]
MTGALLGALLIALVLALPAFAQSYTSNASSQNIDDEALAIENQLQCPVCENVTVAYSTSTLAGQMRQVIHDKLAQGESRDQIVQYFVDRYGEAILTQPPKHGLNLLVWLLPAAGILLGLGAVGGVLYSRRPAPDGLGGTADLPPLDDDDERLLQHALQGAD